MTRQQPCRSWAERTSRSRSAAKQHWLYKRLLQIRLTEMTVASSLHTVGHNVFCWWFKIKQSQSLTRKWAEDHEVQNCMACGKGFTVTVRKVSRMIFAVFLKASSSLTFVSVFNISVYYGYGIYIFEEARLQWFIFSY